MPSCQACRSTRMSQAVGCDGCPPPNVGSPELKCAAQELGVARRFADRIGSLRVVHWIPKFSPSASTSKSAGASGVQRNRASSDQHLRSASSVSGRCSSFQGFSQTRSFPRGSRRRFPNAGSAWHARRISSLAARRWAIKYSSSDRCEKQVRAQLRLLRAVDDTNLHAFGS